MPHWHSAGDSDCRGSGSDQAQAYDPAQATSAVAVTVGEVRLTQWRLDLHNLQLASPRADSELTSSSTPT